MWNSKYNYTENIETKYCHRLIKRSACKPIVIIVKNNISMSFEVFFFRRRVELCGTLSRNFEIFVCTPRRTGAIHGDPKIKEKYSERERVWERRSRRNGDRETETEKRREKKHLLRSHRLGTYFTSWVVYRLLATYGIVPILQTVRNTCEYPPRHKVFSDVYHRGVRAWADNTIPCSVYKRTHRASIKKEKN